MNSILRNKNIYVSRIPEEKISYVDPLVPQFELYQERVLKKIEKNVKKHNEEPFLFEIFFLDFEGWPLPPTPTVAPPIPHLYLYETSWQEWIPVLTFGDGASSNIYTLWYFS